MVIQETGFKSLNKDHHHPLFDIEKLTNFADDNYLLEWNRSRLILAAEMENKIKRITDWLVKSGRRVNAVKTELCLFHKNDTPP